MQVIKDNLSNKIETRLQFLVTIVIFFLAVFPGGNDVQWIVLIVGYIIDYLLFAICSEKIELGGLKLIHNLVLAGIAAYIIPLTLLTLSKHTEILPWWEGYPLFGVTFISVLLMTLIPVTILISIFVWRFKWKD